MSHLPEKILFGTSRCFPIEMLLRPGIDCTMEGERNLLHFVLPPWQRPEVWEAPRKRAFIEGIFLGLGTGTYVHHEAEMNPNGQMKPMSGWLIDGQQRISAIRDFVNDEIAIFNGIRFSDMTPVEQRVRFLHVVFPSHEIPYQQDEQLLKELYRRLNFGGIAHTEQDAQRLDSARTVCLGVGAASTRHPHERQR
jgi:hypothetical protein